MRYLRGNLLELFAGGKPKLIEMSYLCVLELTVLGMK
jgi:hypothetical protein